MWIVVNRRSLSCKLHTATSKYKYRHILIYTDTDANTYTNTISNSYTNINTDIYTGKVSAVNPIQQVQRRQASLPEGCHNPYKPFAVKEYNLKTKAMITIDLTTVIMMMKWPTFHHDDDDQKMVRVVGDLVPD